MSGRCSECAHFNNKMKPVQTYKERVTAMLDRYPGMSAKEADVLASATNLFKLTKSDYGRCGNKSMPELAEVEVNSKTFGCIYFKPKE